MEKPSVHKSSGDLPRREARRASLGKVLAFSALGHAGIGAAAEVAPRVETYLHERDERRSAQERHQRFQSSRRVLVEQSRAAMARHEWRAGRFILRANQIDLMEYEHRGIDRLSLDAQYNELLQRFRVRLGQARDIASITSALGEVLREYDYQGLGGRHMADLLSDKTGSCEQIAELVGALLSDAGLEEFVYVRVYPPNEDGLGHVAPILRFEQDGRVFEYDMVAGGPAFEEGTLIPFHDLPDLFAVQHRLRLGFSLDPRDEALNRAVRDGGDAWLRDRPGQLLDQSVPDGGTADAADAGVEHFYFPAPTLEHHHPFPNGTAPLYHQGIVGAYHVQPEGETPHPATDEQADWRVNFYELEMLLRGFDPRITEDAGHALPEGARSFSTRTALSAYEWDLLSRQIAKAEHDLLQETDTVRRACLLGRLVGYYQLVEQQSALSRRIQSAHYAQRKMERYFSLAQPLIQRLQVALDTHALNEEGLLSQAGTSLLCLDFLGDAARQLTLRSVVHLVGSVGVDSHLYSWSVYLLSFLVLEPHTRVEALQAVNRLAPSRRSDIVWRLADLEINSERQLLDARLAQRLEFEGDDPLSREVRIYRHFFTDFVLSGKILGHDLDANGAPIQAQAWRPGEGFFDLLADIHQTVQREHIQPSSEFFIIWNTVDLGMYLVRMGDASRHRRLGRFLTEARDWVMQHRAEALLNGIPPAEYQHTLTRLDRVVP